MRIHTLTPAMLPELARVYNEAIARVPHCHRASRPELEAEIAPALTGANSDTRHDEAVFVCADQGAMAGFAHVAIGPPKPNKDRADAGLIRFLWYRPGRRQAGDALLDAAEQHCATVGMSTVHAFPQKHRYEFYHLKSAYLSDHLGHVGALLGLRGYAKSEGEVYLDWPDFTVDEPEPPPGVEDVRVEHTAGRSRLPGVTVRAMQGGNEIGICENVSAGEFSFDRLAQDWIFTHWLGVGDAFRGQGFGRWLLQRALWEAQSMGYRHAAISTAWDNHRAFVFYSNFGYRVVDWTYGYRRELPQGPA